MIRNKTLVDSIVEHIYAGRINQNGRDRIQQAINKAEVEQTLRKVMDAEPAWCSGAEQALREAMDAEQAK